jgi:hypothetical protein
MLLRSAALQSPEAQPLPPHHAPLQAATNRFGELVALAPVSAAGTISFPAPSGSVTLVTAPAVNGASQSVTNLAPSDDASIGPGSNAAANFGTASTISAGTSVTADHTNTRVGLLKFPGLPPAQLSTVTAAILNLTIAAAPQACTRAAPVSGALIIRRPALASEPSPQCY